MCFANKDLFSFHILNMVRTVKLPQASVCFKEHSLWREIRKKSQEMRREI